MIRVATRYLIKCHIVVLDVPVFMSSDAVLHYFWRPFAHIYFVIDPIAKRRNTPPNIRTIATRLVNPLGANLRHPRPPLSCGLAPTNARGHPRSGACQRRERGHIPTCRSKRVRSISAYLNTTEDKHAY